MLATMSIPRTLVYLSLLSLATVAAAATPPAQLYSPLISSKILTIAQTQQNPPAYPQYTDRNAGAWQYFAPDTWTSGFFPLTLYELNTRAQLCNTSDGPTWVELAREWSAAEIPLETHTSVGHDVGFLSTPFVEELYNNPTNDTARSAVISFANELAALFSPIVGCTRSWASQPSDSPGTFKVIIDNMMNLEVLFVAEALTGNRTYRDIAISHADKTMQNHIRADGSSFHLVRYNETTGAVISQGTVQGYADSSTWSRGQAWGINGFANMFQHTHDPKYLDTARRMATYFIQNLPSDGVVPWDFNAPLDPPRPADSSAATAAATGLLLLADMEMSLSPPNSDGYTNWSNAAINILTDITNLAWRPEWQSLLSNGTVNNPQGNNLTGIVYGDYYYIKAGNDLLSMELAQCP